MAHDVFISYAVEDKEAADKVCGALEGQGIKCWIAPRDVPYGADYEEAIVDALTASRLLVLILSPHSNASPHVKREIQNACVEGSGTQIIPFRIGDVPYNKALRYYLGSAQWLDASTPPLESHLESLVRHVRARLPETGKEAAEPGLPPRPPRPSPPPQEPVFQARPTAYEVRPRPEGAPADDAPRPADARPEPKQVPFVWLAAGAGALLLAIVVAVVVATRSADGGNATNTSSNANLATPAASPGVNQHGGYIPQPRTPTPTPTPTPAAARTPIRVFPTNLNIRRSVNRN